MPAIRTYRCGAGHEFEYFHSSMNEPMLDFCPRCASEEKLSVVPKGGHIGGSARSKAEKMAFEVARDQYGLTDIKDSTREGESIVKPPPAPQGDARALQEAIDTSMDALRSPMNPQQQNMANNFWAGGSQTSTQAANVTANLMGLARQATAETKATEGASPMHKFHEAMRKNPDQQVKFKIVGR